MKKILTIITFTSIFFLLECTQPSRPDAKAWFDKIALTTGELYPVTEIAPDGQNIRFSPDGSCAVFEVNREDRVGTKIINLEQTKQSIQTVEGKNLRLSFDSSLAVYLVQKTSEEALQAFEDARSLTGRDRSRALSQAEINFSVIAVRNMISGEETVLDTGNLLVTQPFFNSLGNSILFTGSVQNDKTTSSIYEFPLESGKLRRLTSSQGFLQDPVLVGDRTLIYRISSRNPFNRSFQRSQGPCQKKHTKL